MRKLWDMFGGIHPPENKHQSLQQPLAEIPLAVELIYPLSPPIGQAAKPLVTLGQRVLKGQLLAQAAGDLSAAVHAATSGIISAIEPRPVAHPSGLTAPCIILKTDFLDEAEACEPCNNPWTLTPEQIVKTVARAGIVGLGGAGFPTALKLTPQQPINTLIINGTECEPYITADDCLMQNCAQDIVQGILLLGKALGNPAQLLVSIEDNKPLAIHAMQQAAKGTPIEIVVIPTQYPSGGEKQLIQILTGQELPSGQLPYHLGIVVQNVGTAYAVWRAVAFNQPLIERITTVVGESLGIQRNVWTRIGTPIGHVLKHHQFNADNCTRVILGGPMMGFTLDHLAAPIIKTTNCVLVPSPSEIPNPPMAQACIRCGECATVCPAQLMPQQLYWYAKSDDLERAQNHHLMDCIECGACAYVCPSAIPLVQYYRAAKSTLKQQAAEQLKADRARERFEQRKTRFEKQALAKEEKRLARQKAMEEVRLTLERSNAEQSYSEQSYSEQVKPELSAQDRKWSRLLESAQARVELLQSQWHDCDDALRKSALEAQLKQAQHQQQDTLKKRDAAALQRDATPLQPNALPIIQHLDQLAQKNQATPLALAEKAVFTLQNHLQTLHIKIEEAQQQSLPSLAVLQQSAQKIAEKWEQAKLEWQSLKNNSTHDSTTQNTTQQDLAAQAIAKAQAKAAALAQMSPDQKRDEHIKSLQARLQNVQFKLEEAQLNQGEHIELLTEQLHKLKAKLAELTQLKP